MPSICWWPLALLWFGLSQNAILFVVVMGSLLSVTLAMEDGRKQMPKIFGQAGRNLGAKGFKLFWYVLLPASLPFIVSGLKQGWAFAWRSLITAEMLYLSLGLGQVLMMGRDLNDMSAVIAVMILIIAHRLHRRRHRVQRDGASLSEQMGVGSGHLDSSQSRFPRISGKLTVV